MGKQGFDFRWGVPLLDNQPGFAPVYEFMLDHYAEVVTRAEFLCIIHLARYHYNSKQGKSYPSLETIAGQMGYAHKNSVWRLVQSLEDKGMLTITRRNGFTSIYDAGPFTQCMMALAGITPEGVTPQCDGGITPQCDGGITPQCDGVSHPSVPEEKKDKEVKKRKEEKQQQPPKLDINFSTALREYQNTFGPLGSSLLFEKFQMLWDEHPDLKIHTYARKEMYRAMMREEHHIHPNLSYYARCLATGAARAKGKREERQGKAKRGSGRTHKIADINDPAIQEWLAERRERGINNQSGES